MKGALKKAWFQVYGWLHISYIRLMVGNRREEFMAGSRRDLFVDDDPEYDSDASAEIDAEDFGFQLDDAATVQDQGDSGTADPPEDDG